MKTNKRNLIINLVFFSFCIFLYNILLSCNSSSKNALNSESTLNVQNDSANSADSSYSSDTTFSDSADFKLPSERLITFTNKTIPGDIFVDYCNDANYFYFTSFKNSSLIYKLKCYKINSSSIDEKTFNDYSTTTVGAAAGTPFEVRGLRISIGKINKFFAGLANENLFRDFSTHPENYLINIKANPVIQSNQGRYLDIWISASPVGSPAIESATKGRVNPCPPCNAQ